MLTGTFSEGKKNSRLGFFNLKTNDRACFKREQLVLNGTKTFIGRYLIKLKSCNRISQSNYIQCRKWE